MPRTTKVKLGRKIYRVVSDAEGVIRIGYTHAVLGERSLPLNGRTAQAVLKALREMPAQVAPGYRARR